MNRSARTTAALMLPLSVCACYTYAPVTTPSPGMEVRAQLETEAAVRRSTGLDDPIVRYDGVVVDVTPEQLALDVLIARSTSAFQDIEIRDTVRLRTSEVRSIQERKISAVRTALFTVGAAAAAFGLVKSINAVVGGTTDDDGGNGNPTTFRFSLLRWTAGLGAAIAGRRQDE